jgi:hypothetical protein
VLVAAFLDTHKLGRELCGPDFTEEQLFEILFPDGAPKVDSAEASEVQS